MVSKKGQGMSINVIIIAALALVVLVVLIVIFTSRSTSFDQAVSKEGQTELIKMKIQYGDCRPSVDMETSFKADYSLATTDGERTQVETIFKQEIDRCKGMIDANICAGANCLWG